MKRMLLTALMAAALALAAPGVAAAHHGKRHHGARHASAHKRHRHVRHVTFGKLSLAPTSAPTQTTPTTPSSEPAGKVLSFENGVLKITLADGSVVSGKVTEQTELKCASATAGEDDQGDDDQGEDHGDNNSAPVAHASWNDGNQGQQGDDGDDDENNQQACTTAALAPNAVVGGAELELTGAGAVWEKVELIQ